MTEKYAVSIRIWETGEILPYNAELAQTLWNNGWGYTIIFSDGTSRKVNP